MDAAREASLSSGAGDDVDRALLDEMARATFAMVGILSRLAARHELSLTQVRVLGILRDHTPKMAELAGHLGLEKSTVSGLIDRAAHRGLVERRTAPDDARASQVALTPSGRRLADEALDELATDAAPLISPLSVADRRRLLHLLEQL